eukprot:COSAG01_NODE_39690_length_473_cov_0.877005_1_plen_73_part_10
MSSAGRAAARGARQGQEEEEGQEGQEAEEWRRGREAWLRRRRRQFMADCVHEGVPVRVCRQHLEKSLLNSYLR